MARKRDGKGILRVDGREKVSGSALYAGDVRLPGLLFGITLRSTVPHALIRSVDSSAARKIPGVHAVLTASDLPPILLGKRLKDIPLLARDRVRFVGEKVAVVAAATREIAAEALHAISVEYQELPAIYDPEEALRADAPVLHPDFSSYPKPPDWIKDEWRTSERQHFRLAPQHPNASSEVVLEKGNAEEGFKCSARVFEDRFSIPMQNHGFIEPHGCTVAIGSSGKLRIWSCVKEPFDIQEWFTEFTDLPAEQIVVMPVRIGGDFGGKGYIMDELLAYFLARATGRPVQMVMSQIEEFIGGIHRHSAIVHLKSGMDREGRLVAREVKILFNNGAYSGYRPRMTLGGTPRAAGCYRIPNVRIESVCVYTNQVPCGHMRGPGQPQLNFAVESHTDLVARGLGMDPVRFRQLNLLRDGDEGPLGGVWRSVTATEVVNRAAAAIGWEKPKKAGTGRGLALCERNTGSGPAEVVVELNEQGKLLVRTGVPEVGTGAHTVLQKIVAMVFTLDPSHVVVMQGDTESGPFDGGSGGSHVTNATGGAALRAAQALRQRLCLLAAERKGWPRDGVELEKGHFICRKKSERIAFGRLVGELGKLPEGHLRAKVRIKADHGDASGYACHAVEVTVDRETGAVRVNRVVAVHDVGYAINPTGLTGQIEGGFSQGLGMALMEEMAVEDGRLRSVNYDGYKIPSLADMPSFAIELIENRNGPGPFGAKGIGEIAASPTAPAVANALEDAVGVRIYDLPISAEKVMKALESKNS